jgi:hypothetical protein
MPYSNHTNLREASAISLCATNATCLQWLSANQKGFHQNLVSSRSTRKHKPLQQRNEVVQSLKNFGLAMNYYLSESDNPSLGGRVDQGSVVSGESDARMPMGMGVKGDPAGALVGGMMLSCPPWGRS